MRTWNPKSKQGPGKHDLSDLCQLHHQWPKTRTESLAGAGVPRLRQLCQQHGARFQAIDLRWGVSQEASLDA